MRDDVNSALGGATEALGSEDAEKMRAANSTLQTAIMKIGETLGGDCESSGASGGTYDADVKDGGEKEE